jgi:transglutaminase-like putative cysteine protease
MIDSKYIKPASAIDSDNSEIIKLAKQITEKAATPDEIASLLFIWVRDNIRYYPYVPFWEIEHYKATTTLKRQKGFCIQKSALLAALARALNIPSRLGFADITNHILPEGMKSYLGTDVMAFHCWAELYLNGKWLKATPSFEIPLCEKMGWHIVEFDGKTNALLPETDLTGRKHVSYDKFHFTCEDVPLKEILINWRKTYGIERVNTWQKNLAETYPDENC